MKKSELRKLIRETIKEAFGSELPSYEEIFRGMPLLADGTSIIDHIDKNSLKVERGEEDITMKFDVKIDMPLLVTSAGKNDDGTSGLPEFLEEFTHDPYYVEPGAVSYKGGFFGKFMKNNNDVVTIPYQLRIVQNV